MEEQIAKFVEALKEYEERAATSNQAWLERDYKASRRSSSKRYVTPSSPSMSGGR